MDGKGGRLFAEKRVLDSSGYESDIENSILNGPPRNRRRRDRTHFTDGCLDTLEIAFTEDRYPDINKREALADELGVTEDRIQVWFQNRRSKYRRRTSVTHHQVSRGISRHRNDVNSHKLGSDNHNSNIFPRNINSLDMWNLMMLTGIHPQTTSPQYPTLPMIPGDGNGGSHSGTGSFQTDIGLGFSKSDETKSAAITEDIVKPTTTKFKRPWEDDPAESLMLKDNLTNCGVTDTMGYPFVFPHNSGLPHYMLASGPVLPYSHLRNTGTGILFLPQQVIPSSTLTQIYPKLK